MKTIREIAMEMREVFEIHGSDKDIEEFAESVLAKYLEQQEPVAYLAEYIGKGPRAVGERIARTEAECPKDAYPDTWKFIGYLFLAPPIPAGMQFVPVEPTEAMVLAAWGTPMFGKSSTDMSVTMAQAYRNMLTAAKEE